MMNRGVIALTDDGLGWGKGGGGKSRTLHDNPSLVDSSEQGTARTVWPECAADRPAPPRLTYLTPTQAASTAFRSRRVPDGC